MVPKRKLSNSNSSRKKARRQEYSLEQQQKLAQTFGQKVAVFWPEKNRSLIATITGYDEITGMSEILYDHEAISDQRVLAGQTDVRFLSIAQTQPSAITEDGRRAVYPKHLACQECVSRGIVCDGNRPCSFCAANDVPECLERHPTKEELSANPVLEYVTQQKLTKEGLSQVEHLRYLHNYQSPFLEVSANGTLTRSPALPKPVPPTKVVPKAQLLPFQMPEKPFNEGKKVFKCSRSGRTFSKEADWKMWKGWSNVKAVVDTNRKPPQRYSELGRGLRFACPFSGCKRGENSKSDLILHICRHHNLGDPKKPILGRVRKSEKLCKMSQGKRSDLSVFDMLQRPHSEKQATEFIFTLTKRILCSSFNVVKGPIFHPAPSLAPSTPLPDVDLLKPSKSATLPNVPNELAVGAHPQATEEEIEEDFEQEEYGIISSAQGAVPSLSADHNVEMGAVPVAGGALPVAEGNIPEEGGTQPPEVLPKMPKSRLRKKLSRSRNVGIKDDPPAPAGSFHNSEPPSIDIGDGKRQDDEDTEPEFEEPSFVQPSIDKASQTLSSNGVVPDLTYEPALESRPPMVGLESNSQLREGKSGAIPTGLGAAEPEFEDEMGN